MNRKSLVQGRKTYDHNPLRPPKYCLHKLTGQAIVHVNDKARDLGPYGSEKSLRLYQQIIERWKVAGPAACVLSPPGRRGSEGS